MPNPDEMQEINKREEELMREFTKDIPRRGPDNGGGFSGTSAELPRYRCHKEVHAAKILEVIDPTEPGNETDGSRMLNIQGPYMPIRVDHEYVRKHKPEVGGYYVVYADGYKSFSPAKAFEDGYTKI